MGGLRYDVVGYGHNHHSSDSTILFRAIYYSRKLYFRFSLIVQLENIASNGLVRSEAVARRGELDIGWCQGHIDESSCHIEVLFRLVSLWLFLLKRDGWPSAL